MPELVLHSYRRCPFAIRVRLTLEEKGLDYAVIEENLAAPSAELLRLHPQGKVPLLLHHARAIHESSIITEYLDEAFPEKPLRPASAPDRARMRLWTFWCNELFKPDLDLFKYKWSSLAELEREAILIRLGDHLGKLESALTDKPFLLGNELTLADIHVFPFYRQLQKSRPDFSASFPVRALDAWLERITARPSFARAMKKD